MKSLSRRFLISVALTSLAVTILGAVATFVVIQSELSQRQVAYLGDYVRERSSNVDKRFSNLSTLHRSAGEELERRMNHLSDAEARRLAEIYFPTFGDGTRRSPDRYFDGVLENGNFVYGMGAMIARADQVAPQEMAALVSAFGLVRSFGQAARSDYDNFYFFTPPQTRLVMFGPDRPDKLMFYRREAPPDLDISKEEMSSITGPAANPLRKTVCTNLQRLVQDQAGERVATACLTPAYVNGRYVGAFGSSMELTGFLAEAVQKPLPGASSLVVTSKGELIAYPGFKTPGKVPEAEVAEYEKKLQLKAVVAAIARNGGASGVIDSPDGKQVIAYGRLSGPNWYLLLTYSKASIAASAAKTASWILVVGGLATTLLTALVVFLARRTIVWPLRRLAASCEPEAFGYVTRPDVGEEERRSDEVGVLARALRTERDNAEAVLCSLEDRVRERTAQLERANTEKSRFLANMSHELRTPLNGVIAISETLAKEQKTSRGRELAELIVSSGRLLEHVLTDILDFSKIEAGEITLAKDEFAMPTLVRRIAELHRASAEAKGLDFGWSVDGAAEARFCGDTVRLTQVLSNLLSNAVKFTGEGSVRLDVTAEPGGIQFAVTDTGIGFDDEIRQRLFRRFEQADDSIRRRFGGTGLGLAISRSLVELMGGAITVESEPGKGSRFAVLVPLEPASGEGLAEPDGDVGPIDISGCRVLLAEDHPTNQKVVQLVLGSVGVDPVIVENGALALAAVKAEHFDVILMDMQMPEMDGLTATGLIRSYEHEFGLPRTPVIMLTANALDDHVRSSMQAGADLHISKPIRPQALIEAIIRVSLGQRSGPSQYQSAVGDGLT